MSFVASLPPPALPCRLLAFDTSTERMSLAVITPTQVCISESDGGPLASTGLLPGLLALLGQAGCSLAELDAIAFGCGPGAFTGLRTSCSVAQGLALGADKPVLPIDSLMLVAEAHRAQALEHGAHTVWVVQDARMDEVYGAAFRWEGERPGHWQTRVAPALYTIDRLNATWARAAWWHSGDGGGVVLAGSALAVMGERLQAAAAPRLGAAAAGDRASALARLALGMWEDGALLDASFALPVYLRNKVAQTSLERAAAASAKALP